MKNDQFYSMVNDIIWRYNIGIGAKTMMYKECYKPILTHGSEKWTWAKKDLDRLQATETRVQREKKMLHEEIE